MDKESIPLLKTKLHIPPQRANVVFRPRLMTKLGEALRQQHRLTLISARAGSGKTTLASEWLHRQERPSAWLSLDAKDNDPRRFFSYLVEALRQLDIAISQAGLSQLEKPELPPADVLVTELINELTSHSARLIVVLDDYHVIQSDWIHQAIDFLIEHQPTGMHLIITTRVDPPLPLAQLRVRGQLTEIKDRDLLFTAGEVGEFLNDMMELDLSPQAVATIERRTEGWVAGLQMAAISAQGHKQGGDLEEFIEAFGGTNRFILDYLMEEVLNQQSPTIQDFLIETSILEQMCGSLCDAVRFGRATNADSQAILVQLERTNLFVIPLDDERRWYRYHHLFADLLQSILRQRRSAEQIHEIHRRASQWYQSEGYLGEAMSHLLAAQDFEQAASMIDENIMGLVDVTFRSKAPLLLEWIEKLPEDIKRSRPWLNVYRANLLALSLQMDEVEPILDDVEKRVRPDSPRGLEVLGHVAAVRAYTANLRGDTAHALAMAELAKTYLPGEENLVARATAAYALEDTYFATDDMESASQALVDLLKIGEKADQLMIIVPALSDLAAIKKVQGNLHQAEKFYARAHQWLVERKGLNTRVRCSYEFGVADLLREWNQLDAAHEHAMTGMELRKRQGGYNVIGDLALMRVLQAQRDIEGAIKALHTAEQAVQIYPFQLALMIEFKTARVLQSLAVGDVDTASRWAKECGSSEQEQIALARLRLAQGRASDAQNILIQQRSLAEAGGRTGRLIEILSLQAVALRMQGLTAEAETALSQAISLAQPEGYQRVFLDLGQPIRELLEGLSRGNTDAGGYVPTLLKAFQQERGIESTPAPPSQPSGMIDPLRVRELEVLRLLAQGLSNKEIASKLVVTPGTIKQHLKNICRKLDVHGRMQAVRRGQELKLL